MKCLGILAGPRKGHATDKMIDAVQPAAQDTDDPSDPITPPQEVNEGAGPIVDDDGGM